MDPQPVLMKHAAKVELYPGCPLPLEATGQSCDVSSAPLRGRRHANGMVRGPEGAAARRG
jgi:hypothetical protein